MFNPFFLGSESTAGKQLGISNVASGLFLSSKASTFWFNNTGHSNTGQFSSVMYVPVDIGQILPPVNEQYRLVSASLQVKYIGRLDEVSGIMGCAVVYDESQDLGMYVQMKDNGDTVYDETRANVPSYNNVLEKYVNFEYARDSFYYQENSCLEVIRALYFPLDNSYEEYVKISNGDEIAAFPSGNDYRLNLKINESYFKSGFNWFFYAMNAPHGTNCFKVDIFCNSECLPNAKFLNYMPISLNPCYISSQEKKKIIMLIYRTSLYLN